MKYNPDSLLSQLSSVVECKRLVVALSGGLDSMVLLTSLGQLREQGKLNQALAAIHINHAINPNAAEWEKFCISQCGELNIPIETIQLQMESGLAFNLEERARDARYLEFEAKLGAEDCLLMAHHRDDQMETLLLRLMRGSGPSGLASIPVSRKLGNSQLLRPFLSIDRSDLQQYAARQGIDWVEDDSNLNVGFDRNYLRHEIIPRIESRWPGYRDAWEKSLMLSHEAKSLLTELACLDFETVKTKNSQVIELAQLVTLSEARQRNLLRYWLNSIGFPALGWQQLAKLTREIIPARPDSIAGLEAEEGSIRRYRGRLYALNSERHFDPKLQLWNIQQQSTLLLPDNGFLVGVSQQDHRSMGDRTNLLKSDIDMLSVRYRNGGEACRLAKRPTKSLKNLLQEAGIAPWLRERHPLLFFEETLVCIPGIGVCEDFTAEKGENGYEIRWQPPDRSYTVTDS